MPKERNFYYLAEKYKVEMRGERFIFYFSAAFITGNLLTNYISYYLFEWQILFLCIFDLLLIIPLVLLLLFPKWRFKSLFLITFFLIGSLMRGEDIIMKSGESQNSISNSAVIVNSRKKFEIRLQKLIPASSKETYSILKALSIGDKRDIPKELKDSFKVSGAMHLLALSGLHVGFLYGFLSFIFSFLGNGRKGKIARGAIAIPFLWFFTLVTGASPSICRAVIMATVYQVGNILSRENNGLNSLAISALLITVIDSEAPSGISFQLSYCAMLGIFSLFPIMKKAILYFTKNTIITKIWNTAAMTISCQIFTIPLTLYYFDSFSHFSLLTNIISIPLTGVIMSFISVSLIVIDIPIIGEASSAALSFLIEVLNYIMVIISKLQ